MTLKSTVLGLLLTSTAMPLAEAGPFSWNLQVGGAGPGIGWGFRMGSPGPACPPPAVQPLVPVTVAAPVLVVPPPFVVLPGVTAVPRMPPPTPAALFVGPQWIPGPRGHRPHHIHAFRPCR